MSESCEEISPVCFSLEDVYDDAAIPSQRKRYNHLETVFKSEFGCVPEFFVKASGRVNLIGEHIDYSGYSVLPMTIDRDVVFAVSRRPDTQIHLSNVEEDVYPQQVYDSYETAGIDMSNHNWGNYFLAGYKGALAHLKVAPTYGVNVLVHGTVPKGSGLSSSSAFVCAVVRAATHLFSREKFFKTDLAEIAMRAERLTGVEGGGMDQSICYMAKKGEAAQLSFEPFLHSERCPLPAAARFVVADSMVVAQKAVAAGQGYNMRVVECRLAAVLLASALGLRWNGVRTLSQVQLRAGRTLEEMLVVCERVLAPAPYSFAAAAAQIGDVTAEEVRQFCTAHFVDDQNQPVFECLPRARHVYSESLRVRQFFALCQQYHSAGDDAAPPLAALGELMDRSYRSCDTDLDCSCPQLHSCVRAARELGALGARFTGAGWGGWVVCLVRAAEASDFCTRFYQHYHRAICGVAKPQEECVFQTTPASGVAVIHELQPRGAGGTTRK